MLTAGYNAKGDRGGEHVYDPESYVDDDFEDEV